MDHAEFRDFIFGMLFLKRCSDVFKEERERLIQEEMKAGASKKEAEEAAEDSRNYDLFFVPKRARWAEIRDNLHDNVGDGLNKALGELADKNLVLSGVMDHIDFSRKVGDSSLPDGKLRALIKHFNKYRFRNSDFEHTDLLGSVYEYLIYMFAESGGRKGGDFYTPRDVVRMMVRLIRPKEKMEIYDPCCGSGGMLIFSKRYVEEHGGDGKEGQIRKGFIDEDLVEAVIGLGPSLFYGTQIPACILVMRQRSAAKPKERQGKILFINADQDYEPGRAQNYLRPEHAEKIVRTFEKYETIPGYSRVVDLDEIKDNDYNLNIRRYADNAPPPEPHDVRAHLVGGIPKAEVAARKDLLSSHGLKPDVLFVDRDERYYDFAPAITDLPAQVGKSTQASRAAVKHVIEENPGVKRKEKKLRDAFLEWWDAQKGKLERLPGNNNVMKVRADYLVTFEEALAPVGLLDRFKIAGVIASWWNHEYDELKTIVAQGFTGLVDGWVQTIKDFIKGEDDTQDDDFKPLEHKIVAKLIPEYLQELADAEAEIERIKAEKEAFERGEHLEDSDEEYDGKDRNYGKELEDRIKELKGRLVEKIGRVRIPDLSGDDDDVNATQFLENLSKTKAAAKEVQDKIAELEPIVEELMEAQQLVQPYKQIKKDLAAARRKYNALKAALMKRLEEARAKLSAEDDKEIVLDLIREFGQEPLLDQIVLSDRFLHRDACQAHGGADDGPLPESGQEFSAHLGGQKRAAANHG